MAFKSYLVLLVACLCATNRLDSAPVVSSDTPSDFCSGDDKLGYKNNYEYTYDYTTKTSLWINDISEESRSEAEFSATVVVSSIGPCTYWLRLEGATLTGESVSSKTELAPLVLDVKFQMNGRGEIDSTLGFAAADTEWSRNIKRGVLSALQTRSASSLRSLEGSDDKSRTVYETDVLGRCRTTYTLDESSDNTVVLEKKKSLHGCTLNGNKKTTAVQFTTYRNMPEFYQGRLFIETFECTSTLKKGVVHKVECSEESTYKISSRGQKGVQAVVRQALVYKSERAGIDKRARPEFVEAKINFQFADKSNNDLDQALDSNFLADLCKQVNDKVGLAYEHAQNFRALVNKVEGMSVSQMLDAQEEASKKCKHAGLTVLQAIVFANTENSFAASLKLLDKDQFSDQIAITEYPVLSALARNKNPSANLLKTLKSYISAQKADNKYLRKLYLVYSSLVRHHCINENCDEAKLNDFSSLFAANLGSNCADSSNKHLVVASLKSIGNIGSFKNTDVLNACAENKENSLETRIAAIQAFRNFACKSLVGKAASVRKLIADQNEDTEVRINAFQMGVRCSDLDQIEDAIKVTFPKLLETETNVQFLTYVVDYARERGLTVLLNPILNNPQLKEKFSLNFKELSWNNYRYRYSLARDGAIETDASVIYASDDSFVPRSIRFNGTLHLFGMSVNFVDATLRLEGLDNVLKAAFIDKLTIETILKKFPEAPEQLIDILQALADKLKESPAKPHISLSIKVYGSEVFFSQIDSKEKMTELARLLRNPFDSYFYKQADTIKNMLLIDSNVRQPLANGFEFNTFMDVSAGILVVKDSEKTETDDVKKFNVNNLKSLSLTANRRFEIHLNGDSRLALKKKAYLNARIKTVVSGTKRPGEHEYRLQLTQSDEVPLLTIDGKFYKLSADNKFKEVTKFNVDRKTALDCTSPNFKIAFGIQLCRSVERPLVGGSIFEALKPVDLDSVLAANDDEDEDDEDDEEEADDDEEDEDEDLEKKIYGKFDRPKITLSGPYHYKVTFKNPDRIKTLVLKSEYEKNEQGTNYTARLQSVSASGAQQDRLELTYSRVRTESNRKLDRAVSLELRVPNSDRVPLRAVAEIRYEKDQSMKAKLEVENKILKNMHFLFNYARERKNEADLTPHYQLEALLDSDVRYSKHYRLFFDVEPNEKDLKSNLIFELSNPSTGNKLIKVVDSIFSLKSNADAGTDYTLDWQLETARPSKVHIFGQLALSMFRSNIDLSLEYKNPRFEIKPPVNIRAGHQIDLSGNGKSYVELGARAGSSIDHNLKVLFEVDAAKQLFNSLEVQLKTPSSKLRNELPYSVYVRRQKSEATSGDSSYELALGFSNFNVALTSGSRLATLLTSIDKKDVLNSLALNFKRTVVAKDNARRSVLSVKKNDVEFVNVDGALASSATDTERKASSSLSIKLKEYSGSMKASYGLKSSPSGQLAMIIDYKADSLIRILFKVISLNSQVKLDTAAKSVDMKFEINKLGEMKTMKMASVGGLRNGPAKGDEQQREFDITYEKVFTNGTVNKKSGDVKFVWVQGKKMDAKLSVPGALSANWFLKRDKDAQNSNTEGHLKYTTVDESVPSQREFRFVHNVEEQLASTKKSVFKLLAKKGEPSKWENVDALGYLVDLDLTNTYLTNKDVRVRISGDNKVQLKVQMVHADWKSSLNNDLKTKVTTTNVETKLRFPAIYSDPGKQNQLTQKLKYVLNAGGSQKRTLSYSVATDNKKLNQYFKEATLDYAREIVGESRNAKLLLKVTELENPSAPKTLKIAVQRKTCENLSGGSDDDDDEEEVKQLLLCPNTKIRVEQDFLPMVPSRRFPGTFIDVSNCELESKLTLKKDDNFLLDSQMSLVCDKKTITESALLVSRQFDADGQKSVHFKYEAKSNYHEEKGNRELYELKRGPQGGKLELLLSDPNSDNFVNYKLDYERRVEEVSGKLAKGAYAFKVARQVDGKRYERKCDLNVEVKTDYTNKLVCSLKTPETGGKALAYGYSISSKNLQERMFGKHDSEAELSLPTGRTLRVEYKAMRATDSAVQQQFDNDGDDNNEREFKSITKFYWDFARSPAKYFAVKAQRDNYAKTNSKLTLELVNYPRVKSVKVTIDRQRLPTETQVKITDQYELESGAKNQLDLNVRMSSDMDQNELHAELSLQKPRFNIAYDNRFNKLNGRLQFLNVRLANLLKFTVEKDDPENRKIYVSLASPDDSLYTAESKVLDHHACHYTVESTLKSKASGSVLSILKSTFHSNQNMLVVEVNAVENGQNYELNFGVFNETLANGVLLRNKKRVGESKIQVVGHGDHKDLDVTLQWNRVWNQFKQDVLGLDEAEVTSNDQFNSYFGDVYGELQKDLKPVFDAARVERRAIQRDFAESFLISLKALKAVPSLSDSVHLQNLIDHQSQRVKELEAKSEELPLYKRLAARYNAIATSLNRLHLEVRQSSKSLAKYIPRLPTLAYNSDSDSKYDNSLVVSRPTYQAHNLYQFNAEYRERMRVLAKRVASIKAGLALGNNVLSLKALWNKYKYRSLNSFTMVGHVYQGKDAISVLAFNGEHIQLNNKCRVLLTHQTSKNRFSVVLNSAQDKGLLSVSAYGQKAVSVDFRNAYVDNKAVSLPYSVSVSAKEATITVLRAHNGVVLKVNKELEVACSEDSNSCTVSLTRWSTGHVNGLLGQSTQDLKSVKGSYWSLDGSCDAFQAPAPTTEASKACYEFFGKHKHSPFKNAFLAVKPNGWQKLCASVLSSDKKAKCAVLKAFVEHARVLSVEVREPSDCHKCSAGSNNFYINQRVQNDSQTILASGDDTVILQLPCDKKQLNIEQMSAFSKFSAKNPNNRYYLVKVGHQGPSVYRDEKGALFNFDLKKAYEAIGDDKTLDDDVSSQALYTGFFYAANLFADRVAQNRRLVIMSCGNCVRYSAIEAHRFAKYMKSRNIQVISYGNYPMLDVDSPASSEKPVGYTASSLFLYNGADKSVEADDLASYKIEHPTDMCQRLATKTGGNTFDLALINKPGVWGKVMEKIVEINKDIKYKQTVKQCQRLETPLGDFDDFLVEKVKVNAQ